MQYFISFLSARSAIKSKQSQLIFRISLDHFALASILFIVHTHLQRVKRNGYLFDTQIGRNVNATAGVSGGFFRRDVFLVKTGR